MSSAHAVCSTECNTVVLSAIQQTNGQTMGAPWKVGCGAATEGPGPFLSCIADATAGVDKMVVGGKVVVVEEGALVTLGSKHKNDFRFVQKWIQVFL